MTKSLRPRLKVLRKASKKSAWGIDSAQRLAWQALARAAHRLLRDSELARAQMQNKNACKAYKLASIFNAADSGS
ncbi:hypothetical protein AAHN93_08155 [Vandammella animalimorsus]|uniref:hypothetical protein n=1 Tax=Vandammella animalimorsus TaxID=2029117 RepID=UPI00117774F5|nr:hypothetical protein [Vandammella animalimorsus]